MLLFPSLPCSHPVSAWCYTVLLLIRRVALLPCSSVNPSFFIVAVLNRMFLCGVMLHCCGVDVYYNTVAMDSFLILIAFGRVITIY